MSVHQSKWGFHPCDRVIFKKLKELNKLSYLVEASWANHHRWQRKQPQNRIIRQRIKNSLGQTIGYEILGPAPEPKIVIWAGKVGIDQVRADYKNARRPTATESEVIPIDCDNYR
jgi:hypothetical protein